MIRLVFLILSLHYMTASVMATEPHQDTLQCYGVTSFGGNGKTGIDFSGDGTNLSGDMVHFYAAGKEVFNITGGSSSKFSIAAGSLLSIGDSFSLPVLTTAQRLALSPTAGYVVFDSTLGLIEIYNGTSWLSVATDGGDAVSTGTVNTTDATVTTIQTIATASNSVTLIETKVVGKRTGGSAGAANDSAGLIRKAVCKNTAGTASVQNLFSDYTFRDQVTWDATVTASGANCLIQVNGAASNNVTWKSVTRTFQE